MEAAKASARNTKRVAENRAAGKPDRARRPMGASLTLSLVFIRLPSTHTTTVGIGRQDEEEDRQDGEGEAPDAQDHLLFRTDKNPTGFMGVRQHNNKATDKERFRAQCQTKSCPTHSIGTFDTAKDAARAYLKHVQKRHSLEKPVS